MCTLRITPPIHSSRKDRNMKYEVELYEGKYILRNIHTGEYLRYHPHYPGQPDKSDGTHTADIKQAATIEAKEGDVGHRVNVKVGATGHLGMYG